MLFEVEMLSDRKIDKTLALKKENYLENQNLCVNKMKHIQCLV